MPDSSFDVRLGPIIDEFLLQTKLGTAQDVSQFARQHPEFEQQLLDVLPTLFLMERATTPATSSSSTRSIQQGDEGSHGEIKIEHHRIIREVGRGGMGIVYEAIDQSLKRRVAIKVLKRTFFHKNRLKRFQREAQAVATLVHPNIVPIFSVGESRGCHYFSMQFIDGASLDQVIDDLRCGQQPESSRQPSDLDDPPSSDSAMSQTIAQRLTTICLQTQRDANAAPSRSEDNEKLRSDGSDSNPIRSPITSTASDRQSSGSIVSSSSRTGNDCYYRNVARIGMQVAQAIDYAHKKGILHRDIKPANLILDQNSNVWVADFGLAKETELDLTETGEVVGTLRYMSPDRLQGHDNELCDIYAIGASIYELIAMQPVYSADNRATLLTEILSGAPHNLNRIDSRIPASLQTIIEKAMAREVAMRYQSAGELADDLHRFLVNRPVLARQATTFQRVRLWAKRNPLPSAMLALLTLLMLAITIGSSAFAWTIYQKNILITESEQRETAANQQAQRRLVDAKFAAARSSLYSPDAGRTLIAKTALNEAIRISKGLQPPPPDFQRRVRDIAFEIGMTFDAIRENSADRPPQVPITSLQSSKWGFDSELKQQIRCDDKAKLIIQHVESGAQTVIASGSWQDVDGFFSKDDRYVVARGLTEVKPGELNYRLIVWDSRQKNITLDVLEGGYSTESCVTLANDNSFLVFVDHDTTLTVADPASGETLFSEKLKVRPTFLRVDPFGGRLLVGSRPATEIRQYVKSGNRYNFDQPEKTYHDSSTFMDVAWHPRGGSFIAGTGDGNLQIWSSADDGGPKYQFSKHTDGVRYVAFDASGQLMFSHADDRKTRIWDFETGESLLSLDVARPQISHDGRRLAVEHAPEMFSILEISQLYCQTLSCSSNRDRSVHDITFSPNGRYVVWANNSQLSIHDVKLNAAEKYSDNYYIETRIGFESSSGKLLAHSDGKLDRLTIDGSHLDRGKLKFDNLQTDPIAAREIPFQFQSSVGSTITIVDGSSTLQIIHPNGLASQPAAIQLPAPANRITVNRDGKIAAVWADGADEPKLMMVDLEDRSLIKMADVPDHCNVCLHPSGDVLAIASSNSLNLYDARSLQPRHHISMPKGDPGTPVFSGDGKYLAIAIFDQVILFDGEGYGELATLNSPSQRYTDHVHGAATGITFSPDCGSLAVGTRDNKVHVWNIKRVLKPR